jgi:hypothetical protein
MKIKKFGWRFSGISKFRLINPAHNCVAIQKILALQD